jgi:hypothetical protein
MVTSDCYFDEKIENCYKKVINVGIDPFEGRIVSYSFIGVSLLLFFGSILILMYKFNIAIFLGALLFTAMIYTFFYQFLNNKKYKYHGIELDKPIWFSFQKRALKEYNQIVCRKFEDELISIDLLLGVKDDIKLLEAYIQRFENQRKKLYREPIIVSGNISFIVLIITLVVQFSLELFNKNEDTIGDLILFILSVSVILVLTYLGIYMICRIWQDIANQRLCTQEKICDFLEVIRINRLLDNSVSHTQI